MTTTPTRRPLKPCGTPAAYRRHLRNGETACDECKAAHSADRLRYYYERKTRT